jgi:hypothetical protein
MLLLLLELDKMKRIVHQMAHQSHLNFKMCAYHYSYPFVCQSGFPNNFGIGIGGPLIICQLWFWHTYFFQKRFKMANPIFVN